MCVCVCKYRSYVGIPTYYFKNVNVYILLLYLCCIYISKAYKSMSIIVCQYTIIKI